MQGAAASMTQLTWACWTHHDLSTSLQRAASLAALCFSIRHSTNMPKRDEAHGCSFFVSNVSSLALSMRFITYPSTCTCVGWMTRNGLDASIHFDTELNGMRRIVEEAKCLGLLTDWVNSPKCCLGSDVTAPTTKYTCRCPTGLAPCEELKWSF